jgi:hypothetical protein
MFSTRRGEDIDNHFTGTQLVFQVFLSSSILLVVLPHLYSWNSCISSSVRKVVNNWYQNIIDSRSSSMDPAALKFLLYEINRRFDEADARVDRLFGKLQQPAHLMGPSPSVSLDLPTTPLNVDHFPNASASVPPTPTTVVGAVVIVDNWGGCFDDGEQYYAAPSVVADNWGRFFDGEYGAANTEFADHWDHPFNPEANGDLNRISDVLKPMDIFRIIWTAPPTTHISQSIDRDCSLELLLSKYTTNTNPASSIGNDLWGLATDVPDKCRPWDPGLRQMLGTGTLLKQNANSIVGAHGVCRPLESQPPICYIGSV